jgi:TonB family protein
VKVRLVVSENGDVETAELDSGNNLLGEAAIDAFKKWKFQPYLRDGKPVQVHITLPMDFAFLEKLINDKGISADGQAQIQSPSAATSAPLKNALQDATAVRPTPQRIRVSQQVSQGFLVRAIAPVYPDNAKRRHVEGTVVLHAVIGKDGKVAELKPLSGSEELVPAAIDAVQQWVYRPYIFNGEPIAVDTQITVNFKLH